MILEVVAGLIKNSENKFLMLKRPEHKHNPHLFELPGGKFDFGLDKEEQLKRIIKEELDVDVVNYKFLRKISHVHELGKLEVNFYEIEVKGDIKLLQHKEAKWVTKEEALQIPMTKAAHEFVSKL
ncbi:MULTISPECIES: NUDIX domain-containing protein [unclassified Mycoplasma]